MDNWFSRLAAPSEEKVRSMLADNRGSELYLGATETAGSCGYVDLLLEELDSVSPVGDEPSGIEVYGCLWGLGHLPPLAPVKRGPALVQLGKYANGFGPREAEQKVAIQALGKLRDWYGFYVLFPLLGEAYDAKPELQQLSAESCIEILLSTPDEDAWMKLVSVWLQWQERPTVDARLRDHAKLYLQMYRGHAISPRAID